MIFFIFLTRTFYFVVDVVVAAAVPHCQIANIQCTKSATLTMYNYIHDTCRLSMYVFCYFTCQLPVARITTKKTKCKLLHKHRAPRKWNGHSYTIHVDFNWFVCLWIHMQMHNCANTVIDFDIDNMLAERQNISLLFIFIRSQ